MRVQLAQKVQDLLGQSDLVIITERIDDVALLIGQMVKMGFVEILDRQIPRRHQQRGLSWGWTAVIWLAYILTEGDHRKVSVEAYIKGMHHTLSHLSGQVIEALDFSDDRLGHLLKHLSKPQSWHGIERDLNERSIEVHALSQAVIRGSTACSCWCLPRPTRSTGCKASRSSHRVRGQPASALTR